MFCSVLPSCSGGKLLLTPDRTEQNRTDDKEGGVTLKLIHLCLVSPLGPPVYSYRLEDLKSGDVKVFRPTAA